MGALTGMKGFALCSYLFLLITFEILFTSLTLPWHHLRSETTKIVLLVFGEKVIIILSIISKSINFKQKAAFSIYLGTHKNVTLSPQSRFQFPDTIWAASIWSQIWPMSKFSCLLTNSESPVPLIYITPSLHVSRKKSPPPPFQPTWLTIRGSRRQTFGPFVYRLTIWPASLFKTYRNLRRETGKWSGGCWGPIQSDHNHLRFSKTFAIGDTSS